MKILISNSRYRLTRRCFIAFFTILFSVGLVQALAGSSGVLAEAIYGWTTAVPILFILEWWGVPSAQPHLEVSDVGLAYGRRQQIEWSLISSFEVRHRRFGGPRAWFVQHGWEPNGPLAGVLRRQNLPLSSLTRNWWSQELEDVIRHHAVHLLPGQQRPFQ